MVDSPDDLRSGQRVDPGFTFQYHEAFSRNVGWVTAHEQEILRDKRVAIAGMGGVGGSHLLVLTRLGIGAFNLADFDEFELPNFNRQAGAASSTVGRPKVEVLAGMARDINPELDLALFAAGVQDDTVDAFLDGVDVYVDGLDFFALPMRRKVFAACRARGIPAVTAAPLGMSAALLNFLPGHMSFDRYFCLEGQSSEEQALRFFVGLAPAMTHQGYLVEPGAIDLAARKGPSTAMGCELCAGVAASQVLKLLLHRGKVLAAPHGLQYDAYRNKLAHTWLPGGNANPLQRYKLAVARKRLSASGERSEPAAIGQPQSAVEDILDHARWAPSGDNTQPWRFEIRGETHFLIHGSDTREHCVYDLQGHASQLSLGALLETIDIAASAHGMEATVERHEDAPPTLPTFSVTLCDDPAVQRSPLLGAIKQRCVQRRAMRRRPLTDHQKTVLEDAVPPGYSVVWLAGSDKRRVARLMFANAKLRLTMPEAFEVHRSIIEWKARFSEDRIPEQAVGVDPMTGRLMQWTMQSWGRVDFFNRYLAGTLLPRIQLDLIPALACAAHVVLVAERRPESIDDFVAAGRAVQRFWLTATRLGLYQQPEMTPLIFHRYVSDDVAFSTKEDSLRQAQRVAGGLDALLGEDMASRAVWMGRLGTGPAPTARSLRRPLADLLVPAPSAPD